VETLDGTVQVRSEINEGTDFIIHFREQRMNPAYQFIIIDDDKFHNMITKSLLVKNIRIRKYTLLHGQPLTRATGIQKGIWRIATPGIAPSILTCLGCRAGMY